MEALRHQLLPVIHSLLCLYCGCLSLSPAFFFCYFWVQSVFVIHLACFSSFLDLSLPQFQLGLMFLIKSLVPSTTTGFISISLLISKLFFSFLFSTSNCLPDCLPLKIQESCNVEVDQQSQGPPADHTHELSPLYTYLCSIIRKCCMVRGSRGTRFMLENLSSSRNCSPCGPHLRKTIPFSSREQ